MTTFYCTNCWAEMRPDDQVCPCCGADQEALSRKSFTEKLIRALHHPEPETRIRAAFILGKLGAAEAIPALKQILLSPATDPYLAAEAATALGEIGNDEAQQILLSMPTYEYALPVRVAIARAFAVAVKRNGGRRD